jgi:hypothetical protein
MRLQFQVVCTDSRLGERQREDKRLRVIGELLPFVLAKYERLSSLPARPARWQATGR